MRPQQGWPQEKRIKVQPDIAVIPGAQIEVAWPRTGESDHPGFHHVMVARRYGFRKPQVKWLLPCKGGFAWDYSDSIPHAVRAVVAAQVTAAPTSAVSFTGAPDLSK